MGNSLRLVLGSCESPRFPLHLQLGTSAAIDVSTSVSEKFDNDSFLEYYSVLYTADGSTCELKLSRHVDKDGHVNAACFVLLYWLRLHIETIKTDSLWIFRTQQHNKQSITSKTNRTVDACGGVTDTNVYLCGSGNRGGLLVEECKKNSLYQKHYSSVTVAHYFVNSSGTAFNRSTESDIGFSVVAKVRVINGQLDVTVEGPEKHPASALFYLFDEVNRTGIWKPTMCPHCANIERQCRIMFSQPKSEESDVDENNGDDNDNNNN